MESSATRRNFLASGAAARIAEKTMLRHMPRMAENADAAVLAASDYAGSMTAAVLNCTCGEIAD